MNVIYYCSLDPKNDNVWLERRGPARRQIFNKIGIKGYVPSDLPISRNFALDKVAQSEVMFLQADTCNSIPITNAPKIFVDIRMSFLGNNFQDLDLCQDQLGCVGRAVVGTKSSIVLLDINIRRQGLLGFSESVAPGGDK